MHHLFILVFLLATASTTSTPLEVEFYNIQKAKGALRVAIFDTAEKFDARGPAVFETAVEISSIGNVKVQIPTLTTGKAYAIAAFHDLNNNGELDTNMFGIPTEPYAFSNNPKIKWKAPVFAETTFKAGQENSMRLRLATWSEQ
jgi:uncharacterized protein (DUF2141 family)